MKKNQNNKADADQRQNAKTAELIIENLINNELFRTDFFFGTNYSGIKINAVRLIDRICNEVNYTYGQDLARNDVATFVYESFVLGDSIERLRTFGFRSSIFSWIETIARRVVISRIEEECSVRIPRERTAANTRLTLRSKSPDFCRYVIDENVYDYPTHTMLTMTYVDRLEPKQIANKLGITVDDYNTSIKAADKYLRDCIVRNPDDFEGALSDKNARTVVINGDTGADLMTWMADKSEYNCLSDQIGLKLSPEQSELLATRGLEEIEAAMKLTPFDRIIWDNRDKDITSAEIAARIGSSVEIVNNHRTRLNKLFGRLARKWAVKNRVISKELCAEIEASLGRRAKKRAQQTQARITA